MDQFFGQPGRRMVATAMFQKFLAMVGGQGEDAILPTIGIAQHLTRRFHLAIDPPNSGVIE